MRNETPSGFRANVVPAIGNHCYKVHFFRYEKFSGYRSTKRNLICFWNGGLPLDCQISGCIPLNKFSWLSANWIYSPLEQNVEQNPDFRTLPPSTKHHRCWKSEQLNADENAY
ncbi:unnamed protein product [Brugia pahangi]|uniref:Ovule protein n=1 Tax=Brugia pahangi TaxID=6280 RepID=A0A0N4SXC4_BRUPA|nr:unnamed protein product [Brugia pahangi]